MDDEDISSTSLIPDTPSPVFRRSKSGRTDGSSITGLSFLGRHHSSSDLPHDNDFQPSSRVSNGLSLPGSSKFALERQEAVRKKISKKQKSPFSKSLFSLSPSKTAASYKSSTCTGASLFENKSDTNSTYMKSPSKLFKEKPTYSSLSHSSRHTDFMKSSSLIDDISPSAKFHHTDHSDFNKVHSATESCPLNSKAKKRPHTVTAATRWPSSSSSSSEDDIMFPKRIKMEVKSKSKTTTNSSSGMIRGRPIRYLDPDDVNNKPSEYVDKSCMYSGTSINDDKLNVKSKKKKKVSLYGTDEGSSASYDLSKNTSKRFTNSNDIDNTESTLRFTDTRDCVRHKKVKTLKTGDKNMFKISEHKETVSKCDNRQYNESDKFLGYTSPEPSDHTPPHLFHRRNMKSSPSQLCLSPFDVSLETDTSSQLNHWMTPPVSLPACLRSMDLNTNSLGASNITGSSENPIDLTMMSPNTREAIKDLKQVQSDEDMARKLQEELDREYAMTLQSNIHQRHHLSSPVLTNNPQTQTGLPDSSDRILDQSSILSTSLDNQQYHRPPSPYRYRRRGGAASRQRRGSPQISEQLILNLLQHTEDILNADLGPNAGPGAELDHLWDAPTRRGGRRGRRRGPVMFGVFSPGTNGEDYENLMNLAEILGEVKDKGLSKAESSRLPVMTYSKADKEEIEECNICMSDYIDGDTQKILPCFHTYHAACIDKWLAVCNIS
ncbi:E3 ubiquitin-protein ligase rnf38 [Mactra antiquata]